MDLSAEAQVEPIDEGSSPDELLRLQDKEMLEALWAYLQADDGSAITPRVAEIITRLKAYLRLTEEDRLLLKLYYQDGIKIKVIVKLLNLQGDPYKRIKKIIAQIQKASKRRGCCLVRYRTLEMFFMNEEAMSPQNKERLLTLLSLMGKGTLKVNVCPSDELLATFIERRLTGEVRQAMLAHLNHCPSCYYQWLEAASYLSALEPAAPRTSAAGPLSSIWQRLQPLFTDWKMAIPAAALAALVCLVVWWPASPNLNTQISAGYTAVVAQNARELAHIVPALPLPWEREALGFSEAQPTPPTQAFGAGVWVGRQALLGTEAASLPPLLSPPAGVRWPETEWGDYYALGRWTVLVWALAQVEGVQDWREHERLLERLLAHLRKRVSLEEEAQRAVAALERLQALLVALEQEINEQTRAELSRGVEKTLQQLSP
jgi:hypothetical protein